MGPEDMAQWLRVLVLTQDLGSALSTPKAAENHSYVTLVSKPTSDLWGHRAHIQYTGTPVSKTLTHIS